MTTSSARASRGGAGAPEPRSAGTASADTVAELARSAFGVSYLYPVQRFVISNTLEAKPQIVILPTGAGKSMCFHLPALILPGPTLVLLPLLSLLADQLRKLAAAGAPVEALRGGLAAEEKRRIFASLRHGKTRLLLATPEACLAEANAGRLAACGFSHLVVDEAHCVSEWGESFRPAYLQVGTLAKRLGIGMVTAFTATASPEVLDRIRAILFPRGGETLVSGGADRPNIFYSVLPALSRWHAAEMIAGQAARPVLVFCRTREGTEAGARLMLQRLPGLPARFYHAGLEREERAATESWFLGSTDGVLFATSAYGLGVDKPDIRTVAHLDVPPSVEAYLQETGRAGRDGLPSTALLIRSREDIAFATRLSDESSHRRYSRILGYALAGDACRRQTLLGLIGQDPVPCAGCDVCAGTAAAQPAGASPILAFVRAHKRRFTAAQAAAILCGEPGPRAARELHDCLRGWGALAGWNRDDAEAAIRALAADGKVRIAARGPWAGRLTTGSRNSR